VKRRTLANLSRLADEAERVLQAEGCPLPPRADLLCWLQEPARQVTRAARTLDRAERLREQAEAMATDAARAALTAVTAACTEWARANPSATQRARSWELFDPARFRAALVPAADEPGEHAGAIGS
jgi:hypothetical protein